MSGFDPTQFGILMGQLTTEYRSTYAWLALIPHIVFLVLFYLILRHGNRYRKAFALYYAINFVWLLVFVGGWFSIRVYQQSGFIALAMYIGTPILLWVILWQWIQELRFPRLNLDLTTVSAWRWGVAIPFMIWGFWYPPYEWGGRLIFDPQEFLFGAYGLMGCPTTLVPLTLMFLKYPAGNRSLFYTLTVYAVIIGLAMTALAYVPDIPFFLMGLISLTLILLSKRSKNEQRELSKANTLTAS
ncbi:MAG: hypothetical protein JXA33_16280 [Anaerolineae bacterium]|nr:hypothetical protein [Anaerolineae bacterium]